MTALFLTVEQLSQRWEYPVSSIQKKIRQGVIAAMNVGTPRSPIYRISLNEVERFESERTEARSA